MASTCAYCRSANVGMGFNTYQCFDCGGHTKMDGSPTVPTSALDVNATYDGPGKELIDNPDSPPYKAKDFVQ
jgi:hypothetical protein